MLNFLSLPFQSVSSFVCDSNNSQHCFYHLHKLSHLLQDLQLHFTVDLYYFVKVPRGPHQLINSIRVLRSRDPWHLLWELEELLNTGLLRGSPILPESSKTPIPAMSLPGPECLPDSTGLPTLPWAPDSPGLTSSPPAGNHILLPRKLQGRPAAPAPWGGTDSGPASSHQA